MDTYSKRYRWDVGGHDPVTRLLVYNSYLMLFSLPCGEVSLLVVLGSDQCKSSTIYDAHCCKPGCCSVTYDAVDLVPVQIDFRTLSSSEKKSLEPTLWKKWKNTFCIRFQESRPEVSLGCSSSSTASSVVRSRNNLEKQTAEIYTRCNEMPGC